MRRLRAHPPRPLLEALRRRDGATALEFAVVAAPFVFMLFAIIEIGMIFVANVNLSNATMSLARQIRTGGIIAPGSSVSNSSGVTLSLSDFKTAICNKIQIVPTSACLAQLQVDIRTQSSFASASAGSPVSNKNFNNSGFCYYSGSGGSIVQFRAFYLWPVVTPILLPALVNANSYTASGTTTSGSFFVLTSSEVFKVEQNSNGANNGSGC